MRNLLRLRNLFLAAALIVASHVAAKAEAPAPAPQRNIVETLAASGNYTTLVTAIRTAGLEATLSGKGPFTVFAPTDAAFAKLPPGELDSLLKQPEKLKAVLTYHVVSGEPSAKRMLERKVEKTVNGADLRIHEEAGQFMVNDARVGKEIRASNGVIYPVDSVLMPPAK